MAISLASLTSGFDVTTDTTATTASITPTSNNLVLLAVSSNNFFSFDSVTASGNSLTWVQIANFDIDSAGTHSQLTLFRAMGASPTSGAVTITFGANKDACSWSIVEFSGVDTTGTNGSGAVVQLVTATGDSTALLATLASFSHANNATYGAFSSYHGVGDTITPGSGFTEVHDVVDTTTEYSHIQTEWVLANDTTVDATLSSTQNWGAIGVEIKAASSPNVTVNLTSASSTGGAGNLTYATAGPEPTVLTSGADNSLGASALTDSITPTANRLVLLAVSSVNWWDALDWTATGCNLTWVQIANVNYNSGVSNSQLVLFRALGSSPTTGQITISNGSNKDEITWSVVEFSNVDTSGSSGSGAVVQVVTANGNSTTPAVSLATFGSSSNAAYAAVSAYDFGGTIVPETNWVELHDVTGTATYTHTETEWKSDDNTASATLSAAVPWGIVAVEIKKGGVSNNYNLTGVSSTGQVGSLTFSEDETLALTGNAATGQLGTIERVQHGVQSNTAVGTLSVSIVNNLISVVSNIAIGEVGNLSLSDDEVLTLSGTESTLGVGTVRFNNVELITGTESAGCVGTLTYSGGTVLNISLNGTESSTATGSITLKHTQLFSSGVQTTVQTGTVTFSLDTTRDLTGVETPAQTGILTPAFAKTLTSNSLVVLVGSVEDVSTRLNATGLESTGAVGAVTYSADQSKTVFLTSVNLLITAGNLGTLGGKLVHQAGGLVAPEKFKKRPQKVDHTLEWTIMVIGSEERYYGPKVREYYPSIREDELSHTINNIVTSMHTFFNANSNLPSLEIILKREREVIKYWSLLALQTYNASVKLPTPPLQMSGLLDR